MIHPNRIPGLFQNAAPTPYQSGAAPGLAFGVGGTGFEQLSDGLSGAARAARHIAAEDDKARVQEAEIALAAWSQQRLFADQTGYLHTTGKDAVMGAQTISAEFDAKLEELSESLDDDRQKSAFAILAGQSRQQSLNRVARHAEREKTAWWNQTSEDAIKAATQEAALTPEEPSVFRDNLRRIHDETYAIARRNNADEATTERMVRENQAAYIENVADAARTKDPMLALTILEQNRSAFTTEQNEAIRGRISAEWTRQQAAHYVERGDLEGLRRFGDNLSSDGASPQLIAIAGGALNRAEAEFAALRSQIETPLTEMADDLRFGRAVDTEKLGQFRETANRIGAADLTARLEEGLRINADMAAFKTMSLDEMAARIAADEEAGVTDQTLFEARKQTHERLRAQSISDPLGAAMEQGIIPMLKIGASSGAELWADRIAATYAVQKAYGNPVPILRKEEVEAIGRDLEDMDANGKAETLSRINQGAAGRKELVTSIMMDFMDAFPEFAEAGDRMAHDPKGAKTILKGIDVRKNNPEFDAPKGDAWSIAYNKALPPDMLSSFTKKMCDQQEAIIRAHYAGSSMDAKDKDQTMIDEERLKQSIDVVTGGIVEFRPGDQPDRVYRVLPAWKGQTAYDMRRIMAMDIENRPGKLYVQDNFDALGADYREKNSQRSSGAWMSKEQFLNANLQALGAGRYLVIINGKPILRELEPNDKGYKPGENLFRPYVLDMIPYRDRLDRDYRNKPEEGTYHAYP